MRALVLLATLSGLFFTSNAFASDDSSWFSDLFERVSISSIFGISGSNGSSETKGIAGTGGSSETKGISGSNGSSETKGISGSNGESKPGGDETKGIAGTG